MDQILTGVTSWFSGVVTSVTSWIGANTGVLLGVLGAMILLFLAIKVIRKVTVGR